MPAPKKPTTFDAHLGAVLNGAAAPHGGREWVATLLNLSLKTIHRRMAGDIPFLVKELEVLAPAVNSTSQQLVDQALRNYGDGDREVGLERLRAEESFVPANVGDVHEDDFEVTPGGPKSDLALAANKRPKKVNAQEAN